MRNLLFILILFCCISCKKENVPPSLLSKPLVINVASYSYLPYVAVNIECQNINFGLGDGDHKASQSLKPGDYYVYWVNVENGKKYKSLNKITIPEKVDKNYATIHVFENNMVKLIFTDEYPEELPNH